MKRPSVQLRLASLFWAIAAVAFVAAVCANAMHGDPIGFVVTHFIGAMLCFATWYVRLRRQYRNESSA